MLSHLTENMVCRYNTTNIEQILLTIIEINNHDKIKEQGTMTVLPVMNNNILGLKVKFIYHNDNNFKLTDNEYYNIVYKPLCKFFSPRNGSLRHPTNE